MALTLATVAHAADLRALCPDRPLKGTSPCTLDQGHWQVESDLANYTRDTNGGATTETLFFTSPTLKYGVTDSLDLEAAITPWQRVRARDDATGAVTTAEGIGDLNLKAKLHLWGENGGDGAAIVPYVKLPTARRSLGNGAVEAGAVFALQQGLPLGFSLGVTPEADALKDEAGSGRHLATSISLAVTHPLGDQWTLGVELWAARNFDPGGTTRQASLDFAASWLPAKTANWQIDGGVNLGLTHQTPDVQVYAGVSRRF